MSTPPPSTPSTSPSDSSSSINNAPISDPSQFPDTTMPAEKASSRPKLGLKTASIGFRILAVVVILAIAGGLFQLMMSTKTQPAQSDAGLTPIRVRTISATQMPIDRTWDGYGTARSMNDADIVAEVAGRVIHRPSTIEAGQDIRVGEILMRLDPSDYEHARDAANQAASAIEAQLNGLAVESERVGTQIDYAQDEISAAENELERTQQAINAGAGNEGELDSKLAAVRRIQRETESLKERLEMIPSRRAQLLAQLASQRANAATAQRNLDRSTISSPIAGVLQSVEVREGDWIALGSPVARVVDMTRLEIPIKLPASAMRWIDKGQRVELWEGDSTLTPDQTGVITRIAPEADASSRTVTVYVEVEQDPESASALSPGRFIHGRIKSPDSRKRFVVPRRAIKGGRLMIAVPEKNGNFRIEVRSITTGYSIDTKIAELDPYETQWTTINEGLNEGERVVVSLLDQVVDEMLVEVVGEEPAQKEPAQQDPTQEDPTTETDEVSP